MPETILNAKQLNIVQLTQELENPTVSKNGTPLKLVLNNNTLVLKAGSKVVIPAGITSGVNQFNTVTTETDITLGTLDNTYGSDRYVFYSNGELFVYSNSGSSTTSAPTYAGLYYVTSSNTIVHRDNSSVLHENVSFPLCIIKNTKETGEANYTPKAILKRFDYAGYIGRYVFVNPGLTITIPNGQDEDGANKNITYTTTTTLCDVLPSYGSSLEFEVGIKLENNVASLDFTYLGTAGSYNSYSLVNNVVYKQQKPVSVCPFISILTNNSNGAVSEFNMYSPVKVDMPNRPRCIRYLVNNNYTNSISVPSLKYKIADRDFAVYMNGQRIWVGGTGGADYTVTGSTIYFDTNLPEGTHITIEVF